MCRGWLCLCNDSFYVYTTVVSHEFESFQHYSEAKILVSLWKPTGAINQDSAFVETISGTLDEAII